MINKLTCDEGVGGCEGGRVRGGKLRLAEFEWGGKREGELTKPKRDWGEERSSLLCRWKASNEGRP